MIATSLDSKDFSSWTCSLRALILNLAFKLGIKTTTTNTNIENELIRAQQYWLKKVTISNWGISKGTGLEPIQKVLKTFWSTLT